MKTYIVIGHRGGWSADVVGVGRFPCLHHHCLKGHAYRQGPFASNDQRNQRGKATQATALNKDGCVVLTLDATDRRPWKRIGYAGLYRASNARFDGKYLTFDLGEKISNLKRPSEG